MKWLSVDRIEQDFLICEDENGSIHQINFKKLPPEITEGSVITISDSGEIVLDSEKTYQRRKLIESIRAKINNE